MAATKEKAREPATITSLHKVGPTEVLRDDFITTDGVIESLADDAGAENILEYVD